LSKLPFPFHPIPQNCGPYWPEEIGSKKCYDEVEVELLATDVNTEFIIIRDFRLKLIKKKVTDVNQKIGLYN